jgi:hypothetical protein
MFTRNVRISAVVLLTVALIAVWSFWLRLDPSVRPDDVELRGKLMPIASLPGAKPMNGETMAAEVQVKRDANAALAHDYLYVYVPGTQATEFVLHEGDSGERSDKIKPWTDPSLQKQVLEMFKQIGLSVATGELYEQFYQYTGNQPNYTAQLYLKPDASGNRKAVTTPDNALAYAVYVHQERKWGKNVSWSKAVKLSS